MAAELEQAGDRARRRGGWTSAEAFYKRAAMLSGDQPARARRMLSAAEASLQRRGSRAGPRPCSTRPPRTATPATTGRPSGYRAGSGTPCAGPADATAALIAAATELGPVDVRLARDVLVEAVVQAQINGQLAPDGATPGGCGAGRPVAPAASRHPGHGR